jgi:hypothetical protein
MAPQSRPSGQSWPVDAAWKRDTKRDMKAAGISPAEMARRLGCDPSAMTVLFRAETKQSRLVPGIHRELGRPPPSTVTTSDEVLRRINNRWPSLTAEQRALVDSLVEQLATNARGKNI